MLKKTIQELADVTTTTSTIGADVFGKEWLQSVLEHAKNKMFYSQFSAEWDVPKGVKDFVVPMTTSHISFTPTTQAASEGAARAVTEIDNVSVVTYTPTSVRLGCSITKDVIRTSQVNYLEFARSQMAYDLARKLEDESAAAAADGFATILENAAAPADTVFGANKANAAAMDATDVISTALIAQGIRTLKAQGWIGESDMPFVLFIAPHQEETLMNDSQFVNASEYGTNEVVMNGEIGKYLGVKVIVSNFQPAYANWGGGALEGHICFLLKAKVSYGIAWGERPVFDSEYLKDEAKFMLYIDMAYEIKTLNEKALVVMYFADPGQ